jgi:hypothetical protein
MKPVLALVVIAFTTGVSVGVWLPRIAFTSPCAPFAVTLLAARCDDDRFRDAQMASPIPSPTSSVEAAATPIAARASQPAQSGVAAVVPVSGDHHHRAATRRQGRSRHTGASVRSDGRGAK